MVVHCDDYLPELVNALRAPRRLTGRLDRRQQECDEDADDGDHHQQLDERKTTFRLRRVFSFPQHSGVLSFNEIGRAARDNKPSEPARQLARSKRCVTGPTSRIPALCPRHSTRQNKFSEPLRQLVRSKQCVTGPTSRIPARHPRHSRHSAIAAEIYKKMRNKPSHFKRSIIFTSMGSELLFLFLAVSNADLQAAFCSPKARSTGSEDNGQADRPRLQDISFPQFSRYRTGCLAKILTPQVVVAAIDGAAEVAVGREDRSSNRACRARRCNRPRR